MALVRDMRPEDVAELEASVGAYSPEARARTIIEGIGMSPDVAAFYADGELLCIFGVAQASLMSTVGVPWLLATSAMFRHRSVLVRFSREHVARWAGMFTRLENYVDARNTLACAWLRWLGFALDKPAPFGVEGLMFHRFHMGGHDV